MPVNIGISFAIILAVAITTWVTRVIPFVLFPEGKEIPKSIQYLGKVLTPAVMGMLVIYCLKGVSFATFPYGIAEGLAVATVVGLHVWKRNTLLSICVGTIVYMILVQVVFI
ncbi:MAG: AzlD domain-containing protein [Eubacteriales bacterium]